MVVFSHLLTHFSSPRQTGIEPTAVPATDTIKFPPCCVAGVASAAAGTITTNNTPLVNRSILLLSQTII
jgi:hypothetical protein